MKTRALFLLICSPLFLAVSVVAFGTPPSAANTASTGWTTYTIDDVDSGYYVHYSHTSIDLDGNGNPHISYRGPGRDLRYATRPDGCWSYEAIYDPPAYVARENAIAIDSYGLPHISFSYKDGGAEDLKYAYRVGIAWQIDTVDTTLSAGMENDIALDSNDRAHISHWEWNQDELRYSTNLSGTWVTEVITSGVSWDRTAIAVDSNDRQHIAFSRSSPLLYATNASGTWQTSQIGSGYEPSMVLDAANKAHISYGYANDLMYATNVSGSWVTQVVVSDVDPGRYHDIAVDSNGRVHISYHNSSVNAFEYVSNSSFAQILYAH